MSICVIIPSKNIDNLRPCVEAVRANEPECEIAVVDDSIGPAAERSDIMAFCHEQSDIIWHRGRKPFVYAANCNLAVRDAFAEEGSLREYDGMKPAGAVVLLNDDALLKTPGGFSAMYRQWESAPEFGLIASSCNNVGNANQLPRGAPLLRMEPRVLCFVCVLIPRSTWDRVGPLDERFVHYGWEDNDYCRRVREAGLKLGISDRCYVDHSSLRSTFRGDAAAAGDIRPNQRIYVEKWGSIA
jgi:GT2 family glycosyltransferase